MSLATLSQVLDPLSGRAVAGLVVLGWEEARAFVEAAEAENRPVILQCGPGCRAYTPLPIMAAMFRTLAENAAVPVVAHLDHGETPEVCERAIDLGFSSVMYDGSALPLSQNIAETERVVILARKAGVSVEAELGMVGYAAGKASTLTDPDEAAALAATGIDALAISIGNVHLMQTHDAVIDWSALRLIEAAVPGLPLVLHGGSGIAAKERRRLAETSQVCKFNVGTDLRQIFGASLRAAIARDPDRFDRVAILSETIDPLRIGAREVIASF
jgi:fructose-bisphosphate aldolase class II